MREFKSGCCWCVQPLTQARTEPKMLRFQAFMPTTWSHCDNCEALIELWTKRGKNNQVHCHEFLFPRDKFSSFFLFQGSCRSWTLGVSFRLIKPRMLVRTIKTSALWLQIIRCAWKRSLRCPGTNLGISILAMFIAVQCHAVHSRRAFVAWRPRSASNFSLN